MARAGGAQAEGSRQQSGSASYTCLLSAAQPLRAYRAVGERAGIPVSAAAAGRPWARWSRVVLEYHAEPPTLPTTADT